MKTVYILIAALIVIGGGVLGYFSFNKTQEEPVPEGYHRMEDGTLMRNDAGVEGMGALQEFQLNEMERESASSAVDQNARVFDVKGMNFAFDVKEIRVKKGDTVAINFESTDGLHDWTLDEFDAQTNRVQPGTPTSVTFVADEAGTFEYYCSVGNHRAQGMVGTLVVEE